MKYNRYLVTKDTDNYFVSDRKSCDYVTLTEKEYGTLVRFIKTDRACDVVDDGIVLEFDNETAHFDNLDNSVLDMGVYTLKGIADFYFELCNSVRVDNIINLDPSSSEKYFLTDTNDIELVVKGKWLELQLDCAKKTTLTGGNIKLEYLCIDVDVYASGDDNKADLIEIKGIHTIEVLELKVFNASHNQNSLQFEHLGFFKTDDKIKVERVLVSHMTESTYLSLKNNIRGKTMLSSATPRNEDTLELIIVNPTSVEFDLTIFELNDKIKVLSITNNYVTFKEEDDVTHVNIKVRKLERYKIHPVGMCNAIVTVTDLYDNKKVYKY